MVRYIGHIESNTLPDIKQEWKHLLDDNGLRISYESIQANLGRHFKFYVDECEIEHAGKRFLALCFAQTENWHEISATTIATHRAHVVDPFADGKKEALIKKGLHYSDATQDLRKAYTDQLVAFPFKSYMAYGELSSSEKYAELYISLIEKVLPHRLMGCDHSTVEIIFEENSKIKSAKVKDAVDA